MKKILAVSTLMSLIVCNLPELQSPAEITFISLLLRSLIRPPIEVSIIYNGVEYKPGSTIELGSSQAFVKKTSDIILRVTGTENISIDKNNGYSIETTSIGSIDLQASSNFPDVLPVGSEQNVSVITLPDSNLTNEWKFNLNITAPSVTTLTYTFKLLSTDVTPGAIILTGSNNSVGAESFVSSYAFSSTSGAISTENQMVFGTTNASYRVVRSQDNKFIFFNDITTSTIRSFRVNSSGSISEVVGPFVGLSSLIELWQIPNQDRFLALRSVGSTYYTFPYDSTGAISASTGPFGGLCGAYTTISPNGDYFYATTPYTSTADIIPYTLNTSGNLTTITTQSESDLSNRMFIHLKSKLKPYLFTATHTSVPGANSLKVDKILRRNTNTDGTLGQVDTYFDLPNTGEAYTLFVAHPNDRFYYLGGIRSSQVRVKGLNHNINSGDITEIFTLDFTDTSLVNMKVSPDGKHLAIIARNSGCGAFCSNLYIYKINSDGTISLTNTLNRASSFNDFEWGGY